MSIASAPGRFPLSGRFVVFTHCLELLPMLVPPWSAAAAEELL